MDFSGFSKLEKCLMFKYFYRYLNRPQRSDTVVENRGDDSESSSQTTAAVVGATPPNTPTSKWSSVGSATSNDSVTVGPPTPIFDPSAPTGSVSRSKYRSFRRWHQLSDQKKFTGDLDAYILERCTEEHDWLLSLAKLNDSVPSTYVEPRCLAQLFLLTLADGPQYRAVRVHVKENPTVSHEVACDTKALYRSQKVALRTLIKYYNRNLPKDASRRLACIRLQPLLETVHRQHIPFRSPLNLNSVALKDLRISKEFAAYPPLMSLMELEGS